MTLGTWPCQCRNTEIIPKHIWVRIGETVRDTLMREYDRFSDIITNSLRETSHIEVNCHEH